MAKIFRWLFLFLLMLQPGPVSGQEEAPAGEPSLDHMLGSMLMFGFRGASPDEKFLSLVREGKVGNFILFDRDVATNGSRNIESPQQLRGLCASLRQESPLQIFIGVDQEGGQVRRLKPQKGFFDLPSAQRMGQGNPHATYEIADKLGQELHDLGINLDLAPVVDVDSNPFNPGIGKLGRAFNTEPKTAAMHALAFGRGLAKNGVAPALKHFPGQGCAEKDSHEEPVDISACWNADVDLLPFAEIIRAGWPGMIMIGHLNLRDLDNELPASLSKNIVTGLLRNGLHWQGVVISDDLQMKAVTQGRDLREVLSLAVNAGVDILLFGNNLEWDEDLPDKVFAALRALVDEGVISKERVRQSWDRIQALHGAYASRPEDAGEKP